ncbi:MAG: hypothetical protein AAF351_08265 [Pseudomonadota bacterium]
MSQFEFVMVMVSLILALALAQGLRGLSEIATGKERYWPHTLWVGLYVFFIVQNWWAYWDFNAVEQWQFTTYIVALISPIAMFASVYLLLPTDRPAEFAWKSQFYNVRRWFFGIGILFVCNAVLSNIVYFGSPFLHPYRLLQLLIFVVFVTGFVTANERVHKILPIVIGVSVLIGQVTLRLDIGAMIDG